MSMSANAKRVSTCLLCQQPISPGEPLRTWEMSRPRRRYWIHAVCPAPGQVVA